MLEYKSKWYGSNVIVVDRFAPTSKRCSQCGYVVEEMPLWEREFDCPLCGYSDDRDVNAAKNILVLALPRVPREVTPVEIGMRSLKQESACGYLSTN
jgi:transposase